MLGSNFIYKDKKVSIELTSVFNYLINNDFVKYGGNDEACLGFAPRSNSFAYEPSVQIAQYSRYPDSFHSVRPQIRRTQNRVLTHSSFSKLKSGRVKSAAF